MLFCMFVAKVFKLRRKNRKGFSWMKILFFGREIGRSGKSYSNINVFFSKTSCITGSHFQLWARSNQMHRGEGCKPIATLGSLPGKEMCQMLCRTLAKYCAGRGLCKERTVNRIEQKRIEQNRIEQNRTEKNRIEQNQFIILLHFTMHVYEIFDKDCVRKGLCDERTV